MYSNKGNIKKFSQSLNISAHSRETNTERHDTGSYQSLLNDCEVEITGRHDDPEEYFEIVDKYPESARQIAPSETSIHRDIYTENNLHKKSKLQYENNERYDTSRTSPFYPDDSLINDKEFTRRFSKKNPHDKNDLSTQTPYLNSPQNFISRENHESLNVNNKGTHYCCATTDCCNAQYIHKIMQRNVRLEEFARNLVAAREKEKQKEAWKNYIEGLKAKHRYYSDECRQTLPQYFSDEDQTFSGSSSEPHFVLKQDNVRDYEKLFEDLYGSYDDWNENNPTDTVNDANNLLYSPYVTEHVCYPTTSQSSRYLRMNKERGNRVKQFKSQRDVYGNLTVTNRSSKTKLKQLDRRLFDIKNNRLLRSQNRLMQSTPMPLVDEEDEVNHSNSEHNWSIQKEEGTKSELQKVSRNVEKLNQIIKRSEEALKISSLAHIESKIDNLVRSVNTLRLELRETRSNYCRTTKSTSISCKISRESNAQLNVSRSDTYGVLKTDEVTYNVVEPKSNNVNTNEIVCDKVQQKESETVKIDRILVEEMLKSIKIKKDIAKLLKVKDEPMSVHITFDIPTKEIPDWDSSNTSSKELETQINDTESEDKFIKTNREKGDSVNNDKNIEEINAPCAKKDCTNSVEQDQTRIAIAVNTEPLSLLTLLRLSTHSIKQMLSFLLNLHKFSIVQLPLDNLVSAYVCNICGAAFQRPSELSKHVVKQHNLGKTRDCCVCHHVLEKHRKNRVFFTCQYCGQKFTRAYCCELHQQSCAKHFGKVHEISSSQMLLR